MEPGGVCKAGCFYDLGASHFRMYGSNPRDREHFHPLPVSKTIEARDAGEKRRSSPAHSAVPAQ